MTKPIDLSDEFRRNVKRSSWTFEMIFKGFTEHINQFQTLDDWNQLALANPIDATAWEHIYAIVYGFNEYGEEIVSFFKEAVVNPSDQALNTIKEFMDLNCMEFFYMDYGLNAHNLLLEFIIYIGIRLNTTFETFLKDVHKFILDCKMDPHKTSYPVAFERYYEACDDQGLGTKRERELQKFGYFSIKPLLHEKDFVFFCKLIYASNLVRAMNRFSLGYLETTTEPQYANPYGFSPYPNESYNSVIANPSHEFGVNDFLGVHYSSDVTNFQEGLLLEAKLEQFIKRDDLLEILTNPLDSYFSLAKTFVEDYIPNLATKYHKFVKIRQKTKKNIEEAFFKWALLDDNQAFILDVFSHNLDQVDQDYTWYKKLNETLKVDSIANRLLVSRMVDIESKSMKALSLDNWILLSNEYSKYFEEVFEKDITQELQSLLQARKNSIPTIPKVTQKTQSTKCIEPEIKPKNPRRQKFVYHKPKPKAVELSIKTNQSFEELFPVDLFIFDESKIEREYIEQSNVRSVMELVSNAFNVAKATAPPNSNILHRFVALTLFPDKFLPEGAIVPKGKVKVFQANQYPYLEGDVEIILSPKARMFLRTDKNLIRIVSFGNPNYH
jgi:hypothetical protein